MALWAKRCNIVRRERDALLKLKLGDVESQRSLHAHDTARSYAVKKVLDNASWG